MPTYRDEAVVLRTHKLGEADRILTMLSRRHGKVRAVAKGVRRTSSRFGSRLEPFMVADVQLYIGRSLDIVQQAESLGSYGAGIAGDYDRYTAASAMVEAADRLNEAESTPNQYLLLVGGLRSLSAGEHAPRGTLDSYLLRALSLAGWAPSFDDCARCAKPGPHETFVAQLGGVVCANCAPVGSPRLPESTRTLLRALLRGDWNVVDAAAERDANSASGVVAAYAQWHLERGIRSLSHLGGAPSAGSGSGRGAVGDAAAVSGGGVASASAEEDSASPADAAPGGAGDVPAVVGAPGAEKPPATAGDASARGAAEVAP